MVINIISTVNGMENEGMRNIASHMIKELGDMCTLRTSALGNPVECMKNSIGADAVLIFARASAKTAMLAKALRLFVKRVYFVLVQKPEPAFIRKMAKSAAKYSYFSIIPADADEIVKLGGRVRPLSVGINTEKFRPVSDDAEKASLREKYSIAKDIPLVLHVGHLSSGRGLEEFLRLPGEKYERLVVASGMFQDDEVETRLRDDGVHILKEYLPDVSEVYRMADAYLFPTRSAEFVISIPLSVMEALACGIPTVAFDGVAGIDVIKASSDGGVYVVDDSSRLEDVFQTAIADSAERSGSYLRDKCSWRDSALEMLENITRDTKSL